MDIDRLLKEFYQGKTRALSRMISLVENGAGESFELLSRLNPDSRIPVTGITGPPGSGKSTLVNAMIQHLLKEGLRIAVLAVDPSSPFHGGALLGDRIRMQAHFTHPHIYIRSLASRGVLGGLSATCMEITDVLRSFGFDHIFVETVGVGQSEVEVAALADTTLVVLVPEAGDEIQSLKSGLMEVADIFVVNKSDREGARELTIVLQKMVHERPPAEGWQVPVLQAIASENKHIGEIITQIRLHLADGGGVRGVVLLAERAYQLISRQRMQDVDKGRLLEELRRHSGEPGFNLYRFLKKRYRLEPR